MSKFPETLMMGQVISYELKDEIERRYNTYLALEQELADKEAEIESLKASVYGVYELERQLAASEQDALRYRILRDSELFCIDEIDSIGQWEPVGDLDAAIDALLKGEGK